MTEEMNFSNLEAGQSSRSLSVPRAQLSYLMVESTRALLTNATGISDLMWDSAGSKATISGTAIQVESAEALLKRVITHCKWGVNEAKVRTLLTLAPCKGLRVRLAPMSAKLKQIVFNLSSTRQQVLIGSDASNDVTLKGSLISRAHAVLEFIPSKGCTYVYDTSTNGTFLNGVRLPAKSSGKVVLTHGDELLFPEPNVALDAMEFGYMVNVEMV